MEGACLGVETMQEWSKKKSKDVWNKVLLSFKKEIWGKVSVWCLNVFIGWEVKFWKRILFTLMSLWLVWKDLILIMHMFDILLSHV